MKRRHIVAVAYVIGIACDENYLHGLAFLPYIFCERHAVHIAHFDIEQENIKIALAFKIKKQTFRIFICIYYGTVPVFMHPLRRQRFRHRHLRRIVIANPDFKVHRVPSRLYCLFHRCCIYIIAYLF